MRYVLRIVMRHFQHSRSCLTATLIFVLITVIALNVAPRTRSSTRIRRAQLFHQSPSYANLSVCTFEGEGELNCPDARRKGHTTKRQFELVLTRMLRIFDVIARKHSIKYWLYKGTLLGAVRNNGPNRFDADLDIAMLREDYETFLREGAHDLPHDIFLQTEQSDPHWKVVLYSNMLAKLRDRYSCYTYCSGDGCIRHNGLMIDLFVIDLSTDGLLLEPFVSTNIVVRFLFGPKRTPREDIFPLSKQFYDGYYFPVPARWDRVLVERYGTNYMQEPTDQEFGFKLSDPINACR